MYSLPLMRTSAALFSLGPARGSAVTMGAFESSCLPIAELPMAV